MRHPVYHSAPIVPYLEYRFASIIDRRPDMLANAVGKPLKNTDDLVGYVPHRHYQRRDKLDWPASYDVSDAGV
jgi:hypothetical protein